MAERERQRTNWRAVPVCLARAVTGGAIAYGIGVGAGAVFDPILRDLAGGARVPHGGTLGFAAAVVGAFVFWASMRARRRFVGASGADLDAYGDGYSRALAIARADLAAERPGERVQGAGEVRRWSPDLLHGRAAVADEGELT